MNTLLSRAAVAVVVAGAGHAWAQAPEPAPARATTDCEPCDSQDENDPSEGAGAFLLGAALFDLSELNDRLAANGYERIPKLTPVIGGEGHAVFPSGFIAGGRGAAILGSSGTGPGDLQTDFGGGFGMVDLGIALVHTQAVLFSITGGIGGYGLSLGISEDSSVRFDDVLADPGQTASIGHGGVLAGVTLGFDGRVPVGQVERGRRGFFTLGVRVGGLYGPPMGDWSLSEGADVTAGPDTGLAGVFGVVTIGFGGGNLHTPPQAR